MKKILGYHGKTLEELIVIFHCRKCGCDFEAGHGDYNEGATAIPSWSTHCPSCGALTFHFKEKDNGQNKKDN